MTSSDGRWLEIREERRKRKEDNKNTKMPTGKISEEIFREKYFLKRIQLSFNMLLLLKVFLSRCGLDVRKDVLRCFFYWNVEKQIEFCFCWNPIKIVCVEVRDRACQMRRNFFKIFRLMETKWKRKRTKDREER